MNEILIILKKNTPPKEHAKLIDELVKNKYVEKIKAKVLLKSTKTKVSK